jgi:hypothetical protein
MLRNGVEGDITISHDAICRLRNGRVPFWVSSGYPIAIKAMERRVKVKPRFRNEFGPSVKAKRPIQTQPRPKAWSASKIFSVAAGNPPVKIMDGLGYFVATTAIASGAWSASCEHAHGFEAWRRAGS